jgi:hypothetical protein
MWRIWPCTGVLHIRHTTKPRKYGYCHARELSAHATAQHMLVRGLIERGTDRLTDQGRAVLDALLKD